MLCTYARIVGVGLALWGIAALVGVWDQSPLRIVLFLGSSDIFLYAGFARCKAEELRTIVGGMGILYLVSAGFLIVVWVWFSAPNAPPETSNILIRGTIGIVSLLCAILLPLRDQRTEPCSRSADLRSQRSDFSKRRRDSGDATSERRP